jgi:phosphoadenosine phosphosulfate reductase
MTTFLDQEIKQLKQTDSLEALNAFFKPLSFQDRLMAFYRLFHPEEVLMTSSFGTSSVFLLHFIKQAQTQQAIHFINTGFHFPETLEYKNQLQVLLDLNLIEIRPKKERHQATKLQKAWKSDANRCCLINKMQPLALVKAQRKVWVSGLMGFQTPHRANLDLFEQQDAIIKFHPLVDIDEGDFRYYMSYLKLPEHPLAQYGYGSVGCMHCTVQGTGRNGRWQGQQKSECGLHTATLPKR